MTEESNPQKPKVEKLDQKDEQELTEEAAEQAQGGAVDAFIWFESPGVGRATQNPAERG